MPSACAAATASRLERLADIAVLFETARDDVRAAEYWNRAAQAAGRLYAHDETARLAQRGLSLLAKEPTSPARAGAELELQMTYGLAIKTSKGYAVPEVGRAYGASPRALPAGRGPVARDPRPHRPVGAPHRRGRDPHRPGHRARDAALFERLGDPTCR